jgi:S1-C subfamily serine protease
MAGDPAFAVPPSSTRRRVALAIAAGTAGALLIAGFADATLRASGDDASAMTTVLRTSVTTRSPATTSVAAPATTVASVTPSTTLAVAVSTSAPATTAPVATTLSAVPPTPAPDAGIVRLVATGSSGQRGAAAVAVDASGTLVTSVDAIRGAEQIIVVMPDAHVVPASVIGIDEATATAVLRVEAPTTPARTGKAASLKEGSRVTTQWAGGEWGTVSEMGARAVSKNGVTMKHLLVVKLAAGAGWTEGDPLLDVHGSVVALCTRDADGRLIGVPIELAQAAARSMPASGKVTVPWLGIGGHDDDGHGAVVGEVKSDSPAEAAGMQVGDVVVEVGDQPISSIDALVLTLRTYAPGATVELTVVRDGVPRVVPATLAEEPTDT